MKKVLLALSMLVASGVSHAYTYGQDVKISTVIMWENAETNPLYFKTSSNLWCYVPAGEKNLYSLVLTLYASGKLADIHCYDSAESLMGGVEAGHKLHRILAK